MASTLKMPAVIPAGESPFRVKGLVYQGLAEYFEKKVPGGNEAVVARAAREDTTGTVGRFLATTFVPGSWYDALPLATLTEAGSRVRGATHAKVVREAAAFVARRDLGGVYRALLVAAKPEAVASRLPGLAMRYFEFGSADGTLVGPQTMVARRGGVPEVFARWLVWATEGFVPTALSMAGALDVRVTASEPRRESNPGQMTVQIEFRIAWT